jgi:hypothetical protein
MLPSMLSMATWKNCTWPSSHQLPPRFHMPRAPITGSGAPSFDSLPTVVVPPPPGVLKVPVSSVEKAV